MKAIDEVTAVLDKKNIPYEVIKHREVFMSSELAKACKVKEEEVIKVLLFKTGKGKFVAGLLPGNLMAKLKKLKAHIGAKELSIASEKEMKSATGCPPGSAPALTSIFNIPAYIDPLLLNVRNAVFRGGNYGTSVRVSGVNLADLIGAEPVSFSVKPSKFNAKSKRRRQRVGAPTVASGKKKSKKPAPKKTAKPKAKRK